MNPAWGWVVVGLSLLLAIGSALGIGWAVEHRNDGPALLLCYPLALGVLCGAVLAAKLMGH